MLFLIKFKIDFASVIVVIPDQRTLLYPVISPFCFENQLNNPIPFLFNSGPIIEVRMVKSLLFIISPSDLVFE